MRVVKGKAGTIGIAAALAAIAAFAAMVPTAHAYSCPALPPQDYLERADVVVIGVIEAGQPPPTFAPLDPRTGAEATVAVERYLTGSGPERITVQSVGLAWAGSWPEHYIGRPWVFFLHTEDGRYLDEGCSGSRLVDVPAHESFLEDLVAITGPGALPEAGEPVAPEGGQPSQEDVFAAGDSVIGNEVPRDDDGPQPGDLARTWTAVLLAAVVLVGGFVYLHRRL